MGDIIGNNISLTADSSITESSIASAVLANFSGTLTGTAGTLTINNTGANDATDTFNARFSGANFTMSRPIVLTSTVGKVQLQDYNTTGTTHAYNGVISGIGSFSRSATTGGSGGTTIFGAANTYTGGTIVNDGTLLANNTTGSGTGTGAVTVNSSGGAVGMLGGTGTITGDVTVGGNAKVQGGDGTTGTTLTLSGALTLNDNSIIQLALGPALTHSTLARTGGGTWTFDNNQAFTFINLGATAGTYQDIITGLASDPGTTGTWTITNSGFMGTFAYDAGTIDLTLTAVPEPSTWIGGALTLGVVAWSLMKSGTRMKQLVRRAT